MSPAFAYKLGVRSDACRAVSVRGFSGSAWRVVCDGVTVAMFAARDVHGAAQWIAALKRVEAAEEAPLDS